MGDTKIQFEFNYENVPNDYYSNGDNNGGIICPSNSWYLTTLDNQINSNNSIPSGINIYFMNSETYYTELIVNSDCSSTGAGYGCSQGPSLNLFNTSQIAMPDLFLKYYAMENCATVEFNQPWSVVREWFIESVSGLLAHEIGHSFSWAHCNKCNNDCNVFNPHMMNQCGNMPGNYLSPDNITMAHRVFGMTNVRQFVANCQPDGVKVLESDELWDVDLKVYRDILIPFGKTLTLTCNLEMLESSKIIIEPGGKLIIDGGHITRAASCDGFWSGIEVHGTSTLTQNSTNQGIVEMKNGAVIEYAENGIRTIGDNGTSLDWTKTGGIVKIYDGTFRNCRRGIEFMSYHNVNAAGVELRNVSFIHKTEFITSEGLPGGLIPYAGITMYDVLGIKVKNCNFENQRTNLAVVDVNERGSGIHTIDASYEVESGYALGTGAPVPNSGNTFSNLYYGVYTTGGTSLSNVTINDNDFYNCAYGVGLNGCNYGVVGRNTFALPGADYSFYDPYSSEWWNYGFGVYTQGAYGYNIEENTFSSINPTVNLNTLSVHSNNSSSVSSGKIYRNTINNTTIGSQTVDNNLNLKIDCNKYIKGSISIIDFHHANGNLADQGNQLLSGFGVNNTFIGNCNNNSNFQIYQSTITANDFLYIYEIGTLSPTCHNIGSNAQINTGSGINQCPITLRNKIIDPFNQYLNDLQAEFIQINDDILTTKDILASGNDQTLIDAIYNLEGGELKNILLGASPYLSDLVLIAYLNKIPQPSPGHIQQILAANSPISDEVMAVVNELNLPKGTKNVVGAAQVGISERDLLESSIRVLNTERLITMDAIVRVYLDTNWVDSALVFLENEGSVEALCSMVPIEILKDSSRTTQHISDIRTLAGNLETIDPYDSRIDEMREFCDFHEKMKAIVYRKGGYFSMKASEKLYIEQLANSNLAISANAKSILYFLDGKLPVYAGEDPIIDLSGARYGEDSESTERRKEEGIQFTVSPNPTESSVVFNIEKIEFEGLSIVITDMQGKVLKTIALTDKFVTYEFKNVNGGVYFAHLLRNGKIESTQKIIYVQR